MSPEQRLHFHQVESGPRMKDLEAWFKKQFAERKVEPNSGLGEAILYMQKYWDKLTLFLRQAGAPLDNNIVERTLKILHRKNALFYKATSACADLLRILTAKSWRRFVPIENSIQRFSIRV
jgi:transposase